VTPAAIKSNMDVAKSRIKRDPLAEQEIEKVHTPGVKDIESLAKFFGSKKSIKP